MKPILFIYSSCDGQTKKIIQHIKDNATYSNIEMQALDEIKHIDGDKYRSVLIGASIRYGKFRPELYQFIEENEQVLNHLPTAFYGVCLTARKPEKDKPENNVYMTKFNQRINWQPQLQAVFAGALLYSRYNWWQTMLIQLIMKMTGGSTDSSKDIELTNWDKVEQFTVKYNALIAV